MKKLIIIGNGFDKAHNLRTRYSEFIEDLFTKKYFKTPDSHPDILKFCSSGINTFDKLKKVYKDYNKKVQRNEKIPFYYSRREQSDAKFVNFFIELLLIDFAEYNWCDVELKYFEQLMLYDNNQNECPYICLNILFLQL